MEKYFIASMSGADQMGNKTILRLLKFFGSARAAWYADVTELKKARLNKNAIDGFISWRGKHPDAPERLADYCDRKHIGLCSYVDEDYPPLLKETSAPPMFFYYRGKVQALAERIAIVGTRNNTDYGRRVALELGENLAAAGLTVVSGAARGIDTYAHHGALKSGRTVAVLGHGLNWVYPSGNRKLLEQIPESGGVVLSEFHPNQKPNEGTFPTRNRIISGLCRGVIVVEAGQRSGALLTSGFAADDSRDVFVVPGGLYSKMSVGCNTLIHDGALLIRNAWDVLEFYNLVTPNKSARDESSPATENLPVTKNLSVQLDGVAAKVFELIPTDNFITDDEILDALADVEPHELPQILLELEMKSCIVEDSGRYRRKL